MEETLLEQRHPTLGALLRLWTAAGGQTDKLMETELAPFMPFVARLGRDGGGEWSLLTWCPQLYEGTQGGLFDGSAAREEAATAADTRRPVLTEQGPPHRRVARLTLPMISADGAVVAVLCGIGECDRHDGGPVSAAPRSPPNAH
jgi:hypothetical protein